MVAIAVNEQDRRNFDATDDVDAVWASAEKPRLPARLPASRGSAPAPLSSVRRVRPILVPFIVLTTLAVLQPPS